mgnify:FL=1
MSACLELESSSPKGELFEGCEVLFIADYDVVGHNVSGSTGVVIRTRSVFEKPLVYVPSIKEWCEPKYEWIELVDAASVSEQNKKFLKRIKTLEYSC